ncbi:trichohyalin-like [Notolabrus celidotus]|uniref:trichohyalin-like n=1 Tax=Notolabrus celidotus TaxID=1203425 RepID=UPI00148F90F6|nr:trichohyalin-like [Notolabrus celidotus]
MSEPIKRKSSSRQLLQNLIRSDEELKPSCRLVLEEDEGFSDWSHRLENRNEQEVPNKCGARKQKSSTSQWKPEPAVEKQQEDKDEGCKLQQKNQTQEAATRPTEKMSNINRKEARTSYSSSVFLPQDVKLPDRTSYLVAGTMKTRGGACRVDEEVTQEQQKEEKEVQPELQREWRSHQKEEKGVQPELQREWRSHQKEEKEVQPELQREWRSHHKEVQPELQREWRSHQKEEKGVQPELQREWRSHQKEEKEVQPELQREWRSHQKEEKEVQPELQREGRSHQKEEKEVQPEQQREWRSHQKEEKEVQPELHREWRSHQKEDKEVHPELQREWRSHQKEEKEVQPELHREWRSHQKEDKEVHPEPQRKWRSQQSQRHEDDEEEEELRFTHEEKEDLKVRREERYKEEEGEEEEEEHKMPDEWSVESRSSEEMNRRSAVSVCSSSDGEELLNCYGPMSPTFKKLLVQFYPDEANSRTSTDGKCKIIERTESLRKSTSSTKKTPPPVPISRINKKLEQYTHALEVSSKESRSGSQVPTDLTSPAEPVSSKKNLFEGGDAWNQNSMTVTPSKDADSLKVGVADLINQWVKGGEDASRCSSPCRPADSSAGKKYKFVVTGHGKYEKVSDDQDGSYDGNCQSAEPFYEDL